MSAKKDTQNIHLAGARKIEILLDSVAQHQLDIVAADMGVTPEEALTVLAIGQLREMARSAIEVQRPTWGTDS